MEKGFKGGPALQPLDDDVIPEGKLPPWYHPPKPTDLEPLPPPPEWPLEEYEKP